MLAGLVAAWLLPIIGWRYLFLVGLSPLVLVFMIRYWVPESPRWLIRMGRQEEARRSLAWALMIDPKEITLPPALPALERTRWLELFKYPRLVAAGCLTGLTQTGGASLGLWGATLLVIVLNITPAHAAFLMVWVGLSGIARPVFHHRPDRAAGTPRRRNPGLRNGGAIDGIRRLFPRCLYRQLVAVLHACCLAQTFFSSAIYSVVGPYMSEIWPARLRSSGMGMSYGIGNLGGKVLGPAGLGGDHGCRRHHQAGGTKSRHARPGFCLFRLAGTSSASSASGCSAPKPRAAPSRRWTARSAGRPAPRDRWRKPPATDRIEPRQRFWVQSSRHRKSGPS